MSSEVQRYITGIMTPVEMANPGPASISARQTVVVTYEDYAALEAENARLLAANLDCVAHFEQMRAQLAAIQGGMGEVAGFDRNAAYAACPESGCDWGSFYVGWKAAATQHQRITAAMAADVERLKHSQQVLMQSRNAHRDERDALRAELAATSEAQAHTSEAAPGVVGLVKALEDCAGRLRLLIDSRRHKMLDVVAEEKARAALSTWRQAHTPSTLPASSAEE